MNRIHILITDEDKKELQNQLETLRPKFGRRGQTTDFIRPAIEKFVEAAKQNRGIEFIEYIKSWS